MRSVTQRSTPCARADTALASAGRACEHVFVRWDNLTVDADEQARLPGYRESAVVRRFDAPEALDTRFYEVRAKIRARTACRRRRGCRSGGRSTRIGVAVMPACYCFARPTHTYLDFDAGRDFEREIVVKVNAPEVLRAELARPSWKGEHVAMGTNTDPYQWVEGRYRLMQGIWEALRDARNPCSILTKSPLLLRDLPLLQRDRRGHRRQRRLSVPTLDEKAWRATEPHTPHPRARLEAVGELNRAGIPCGILVAPLMPGINDAPEQVEPILELAAANGATGAGGIALHLRGEVRERLHGLAALAAARPRAALRAALRARRVRAEGRARAASPACSPPRAASTRCAARAPARSAVTPARPRSIRRAPQAAAASPGGAPCSRRSSEGRGRGRSAAQCVGLGQFGWSFGPWQGRAVRVEVPGAARRVRTADRIRRTRRPSAPTRRRSAAIFRMRCFHIATFSLGRGTGVSAAPARASPRSRHGCPGSAPDGLYDASGGHRADPPGANATRLTRVNAPARRQRRAAPRAARRRAPRAARRAPRRRRRSRTCACPRRGRP